MGAIEKYYSRGIAPLRISDQATCSGWIVRATGPASPPRPAVEKNSPKHRKHRNHAKPRKRIFTPLEIGRCKNAIRTIAIFVGVAPEALMDGGQKRYSIEREVLAGYMREVLNMSYPEIADAVGFKTHAGAMYSYRRYCANKKGKRHHDLASLLAYVVK